jgi:hypothetical protein
MILRKLRRQSMFIELTDNFRKYENLKAGENFLIRYRQLVPDPNPLSYPGQNLFFELAMCPSLV